MSILKWIGMGDSRKTTTNEPWNSGSEKYFGLENFGNTCYCNSILQALYFCKPFRECAINFPNGPNGLLSPPVSPTNSQMLTLSLTNGITSKKDVNGTGELKANGDASSSVLIEDTLFSALKDLFWKISSQKKRTGVMAPNGFIAKLKKENDAFRSTMQQDAHEFLNYILNAVAENVMEQQKKMEELERQKEQEQLCDISEKSKSSVNGASINESEESGNSVDGSSFRSSENTASSSKTTWVHQLFEGTLTNETKCLTCETVTSRDDPFLDLSIDIEQNSSVTSCLRQFSASEMLVHQDKFFCDVCCGLQEAEKRMKIKKLPNVLALHLKRFKYQEKLQKYIKLSYRVVFPFELRLFNTCDNIKDPDRLYELYAICVHIGSGPYHGHYVTLVKSMEQWLLFDDDSVEPVDESEIQKYFGDLSATGSGYVLFYQACDLDLGSLGLPYSVWANNVASSASSADYELSAEGATESNAIEAQSTPTTTNGVSDSSNNNTPTPSINNEEPKRERQAPVREPSFSERLISLSTRKNNPDKRKSHVDQDSKDNDDNNDKSEKEKTEKEKTSWFGSSKSINKSHKEKDKDKKDDKDEKKTTSNLESLFEENTPSKKDKKAEKEEKKREKKAKSENKKMEKLAASNGIKS